MLHQMTVQVPPHSSLLRASTLARKWLAYCIANHAACMNNSNPSWYPTRLLEIEPKNVIPTLIESKASILRGRYACLSHCWGSLPIVRLLRDNCGSFRKGIDPVLLPKTFGDAIDFCKELGLRYLWIDSLCIIQDSLDDWREESNMMCQVYRNSALCLSAAGAKDASKGFYFDRKAQDICPFPPCPDFLSDDRKPDTQNLLCHNWYLVPGDFYTNLCVRTHTFDIANRPVASQVQMTWEALVTEYTRCDLSNPGDTLIALSGMAQSVWLDWRSKLDGEVRYLAGIWNIHLPQALLWTCTHGDVRPSVYRAPTWSWPSLDGRIDCQPTHWNHAYECKSTVLDVQVSYVKSCWGQVRAGNICVKEPFRKI